MHLTTLFLERLKQRGFKEEDIRFLDVEETLLQCKGSKTLTAFAQECKGVS